MKKNTTTPSAARLRSLHAEIKRLQAELAEMRGGEEQSAGIAVQVKKNQAHFQNVRRKSGEERAIGTFFIELLITAGREEVFIPLSIASGKKTAGFMYQIEGTAPGSLVTADVRVRGDRVVQVTLGTLRFAQVPAGGTVSFQIRASIRGSFGKTYNIVISRLNYKHHLADARYQQYVEPIPSDSVKFS